MFVRLWSTAPDGAAQTVAQMPLRDGQPNVGDTFRIRMEEVWVVFQVINRTWVVEPNENGGGVTVSLNVQVTQIGAVPDASVGDHAGDAGDDGGRGGTGEGIPADGG